MQIAGCERDKSCTEDSDCSGLDEFGNASQDLYAGSCQKFATLVWVGQQGNLWGKVDEVQQCECSLRKCTVV